MELVVILLLTNIIGCTGMVAYHAGCNRTWRSRRPAARAVPLPPPAESLPVELGDYVHRGIEELTVMLAQAARNRPS